MRIDCGSNRASHVPSQCCKIRKILMDDNASEACCVARTDLTRAYVDPLYSGDPPEICDYCQNLFEGETYSRDCTMPGKDYWGYFKNNRLAFDWGRGSCTSGLMILTGIG